MMVSSATGATGTLLRPHDEELATEKAELTDDMLSKYQRSQSLDWGSWVARVPNSPTDFDSAKLLVSMECSALRNC